VGEVVSKFWLTLWNTYSFFITYANLDGWKPPTADNPAPPIVGRDELDRWVLAELHLLTRQVTQAYEDYDATGATRPIQAFVESLSNWYVRLSRRRFWKSENDNDKQAAYATLYEVLVTLSKLIAPAMPFMSEALYTNLVSSVDESAPDSVHLSRWPEYDPTLIDTLLIQDMRVVQRLVSLGLSARNNVVLPNGKKTAIGVRQPLARAMFVTRNPNEAEAVRHMSELIRSELNVKEVAVMGEPEFALNPLPQVLGKKFGKDFGRVQKALREGAREDVQSWGATLRGGKNVSVMLDGQTFEVTPEEVEVRLKSPEGYASAEDSGYMASIDPNLTEELVLEGLAREVVRRVQTLRKEADFNISDRITIKYTASERLSRAIEAFADYIRQETLSDKLEQGDPANGFHRGEYKPSDDKKVDTSIDGETLLVGVQRVES
jgi:isoleucyl-tRNA synthetase